jgi:hypothetical protein
LVDKSAARAAPTEAIAIAKPIPSFLIKNPSSWDRSRHRPARDKFPIASRRFPRLSELRPLPARFT